MKDFGEETVPAMADSNHPFKNGVEETTSSYESFQQWDAQPLPKPDIPTSENGSGGALTPSASEMTVEECLAVREWKRENASRLEMKEKLEKEQLIKITAEADMYMAEFYRKRELACKNNKVMNREKEKGYLIDEEKFYSEANKDYWKAIAELLPTEVPCLEKNRGNDNQKKKPSIVVIQGPKPGRPTELSRMRKVLYGLKHSTPSHLNLSPPSSEATDANTTAPPEKAPMTAAKESFAVA